MSAPTPAPDRRLELALEGAAAYEQGLPLVGDHEELGRIGSADLRILDGQLAILNGLMRERLEDAAVALSRDEVVALSVTLSRVHSARYGIHDHLGGERLRRFDDLDRALAALRRITDQDQLLDVVCETVVSHCGFDRVLLSRVEGDDWRPWRSHARHQGDRERSFRDWLHEVPRIRLEHLLPESAMVRRREPAIILDAVADVRVHTPLSRASGHTSYVAAPILSGDRVIGLLHADHDARQVTPLDRDVLWTFATGFAQVFERAVLLARLRDQRAEMVRALKTAESVLDDLATVEVGLATRDQVRDSPRRVPAQRSSGLETLLTGRELEVLALMATGATNDRIAQRLCIATDTVKSHVKRVLRKLRVENRAEAISQYLRLTIGGADT